MLFCARLFKLILNPFCMGFLRGQSIPFISQKSTWNFSEGLLNIVYIVLCCTYMQDYKDRQLYSV